MALNISDALETIPKPASGTSREERPEKSIDPEAARRGRVSKLRRTTPWRVLDILLGIGLYDSAQKGALTQKEVIRLMCNMGISWSRARAAVPDGCYSPEKVIDMVEHLQPADEMKGAVEKLFTHFDKVHSSDNKARGVLPAEAVLNEMRCALSFNVPGSEESFPTEEDLYLLLFKYTKCPPDYEHRAEAKYDRNGVLISRREGGVPVKDKEGDITGYQPGVISGDVSYHDLFRDLFPHPDLTQEEVERMVAKEMEEGYL